MAVADLDQKADQENEAEMSADESAAALQGQLVGQLNFNVQAGAAIASSDSGDVDVEQDGVLTAGAGGTTGDGITANSKAIAVAKLEQEADQKNETSATAELENPTRPVVIDVIRPAPAPEPAAPVPPVTLITLEAFGLQGQLIGQANLNAQFGLAVADADSGDVDVKSYQDPSLGNGITANSTAVAKAELNQDIDQSNENEASIVLPELSPEAAAPSPNTIVLPTEEVEQFEGVLQANLSLQAAAAFATSSRVTLTLSRAVSSRLALMASTQALRQLPRQISSKRPSRRTRIRRTSAATTGTIARTLRLATSHLRPPCRKKKSCRPM